MCRTGSLGDYLGLPTFGTRISSTVTLVDKPCAANSRAISDTPLSESMKDVRAGRSITGQRCASSLNTNGNQTIVFTTASSSTAIPQSTSQVGVDITLTGGESSVFEGVRGYFIFLSDDSQYVFDLPIEFKKSLDGVVSVSISSIDASDFGGVQGTPFVAITSPDIANPISFANISFNATYRDWETKEEKIGRAHV